jgi:hypothetical protein
MFKRFELCGVPRDRVVRVLTSSATTGQRPSKVFLDKATAFRQSKALTAVLSEHIGKARRPYLVLDTPEAAGGGGEISARAAGIRGLGNFARETVFGLRRSPAGQLGPDFDLIRSFLDQHEGQPLLLFGFTFIVWSAFVLEAERQGVRFQAPQATLLHSGGWKKLQAQSVTSEGFRQRTARVIGCRPEDICEFYGMVEQVGTIFVDCEQGHKHVPAFAEVILRRPGSLSPAAVGESGVIEVISVLPTSYPGHVLITEDEGLLAGVDDCACGRKGVFFDFLRRIERAELRGCGDTFAATPT